MSLRAIANIFVTWIDVVARALLAIGARFQSPRCVRLVAADCDLFNIEITGGRASARSTKKQVRITPGGATSLPAALARAVRGGKLELALQPDRFLCRPLGLPRRGG